MSAHFSPAMQAALDRYEVPNLSDGFADRLVARAAAESAVARKAVPRRRTNSPWKRIGQTIASIGMVGFLSATAAAMGAFGEPVEVPLISNVAREWNLVEAPVPTVRENGTNAYASNQMAPEKFAEAEAGVTASTAKKTLSTIIEHPRFETLSPRQKRVVLRRASRRLVGSGRSSRDDIKSAFRDIRTERLESGQAVPPEKLGRAARMKQRLDNATPEQKARIAERLEDLPEERQAVIKERLGLEDLPAETSTETSAEPEAVAENPAAQATPAADEAESSAEATALPPVTSVVRQQRIDQLKERYRDATPEQRAIMRERMQERRNQLRSKQQRERGTMLRRRKN
ncbi:MAG: hypothetical protein AB8B54_01130 [Sphingorhabdus sp.]